jgi:hypothetical protein
MDIFFIKDIQEGTGYGTFKKGHIALQGLENETIWFRNIKIRRL